MLASVHPSFSAPNVSRETVERLNVYAEQLLKWNARINLVSATTVDDLWKRHIEDSLQVLPLIPESAQTLADLGSGAGLPGLVIAIASPALTVTLVEIDQRKSAFLNEVKARLQLDNVSIVTSTIEAHANRYDVLTARALASLEELLGHTHRLLKPEGIALFPKGEQYADEITQAEKKWNFDYTLHASATHDKARIVSISKLMPKAAH